MPEGAAGPAGRVGMRMSDYGPAAAKIKIFEIQGELSESELSSFIDLVFLRLNIRPTEKNSKQIINPWDTV